MKEVLEKKYSTIEFGLSPQSLLKTKNENRFIKTSIWKIDALHCCAFWTTFQMIVIFFDLHFACFSKQNSKKGILSSIEWCLLKWSIIYPFLKDLMKRLPVHITKYDKVGRYDSKKCTNTCQKTPLTPCFEIS